VHSIKTAVVVSILLVVGYAVYTTLNNERSASSPSPGGDDWPRAARVDAPDGAGAAGGSPLRRSEKAFAPNGASGARPPWDLPGSVGGGPPSGPNRTGPTATPKSDRTSAGNPLAEGPGSARQAPQGVRPEFQKMMEAAQQMIRDGLAVRVLRELSVLYGASDLSAEESRQVTELLGQLAGEVIYSRKPYLEQPHVVQPGDTLERIAQQYQVPSQLLAKINGVQDPNRLAPGSRLKVLRGPFDAIVYPDRLELVLQVQGLYAGRFPIGIGRDQARLDGSYAVTKKTTRPTYHGPNGAIPPEDPDNPLGKYWIGLNEQIGIHGTNDMRNLRRRDGRGTICLGDRDIEDVYDILSAASESCPGSKVTFRRSGDSPQAVAERDAGAPGRR
jgi:LysM repeat protein